MSVGGRKVGTSVPYSEAERGDVAGAFMTKSSVSGASHFDMARLIRIRPRQGQRQHAAIETGGDLVGINPERQCNGACKWSMHALAPMRDGVLVDRLCLTLAAQDHGILVHGDVELIRA